MTNLLFNENNLYHICEIKYINSKIYSRFAKLLYSVENYVK